MPLWMEAGLWGFIAASALLVGAVLGWFIRFSPRTIAYIMAFGSGILLSALSFELVAHSLETAGFGWVSLGFIAGALIYSLINYAINTAGVKHRKRSEHQQNKSSAELSIAAGTLLDGIPESLVIGLSVAVGGKVSLVALVAIFISNIPEALSSSVGMRNTGRSAFFVFGLWCGIAILSSIMAMIGANFFGTTPVHFHAIITCIAAGGVFAMIIETMIPEAFEDAHEMSGMMAAFGFVAAIALQMLEA